MATRPTPSIETARAWLTMCVGLCGVLTQSLGVVEWREWVFGASLMLLLGGTWDQFTRFFGGGGPPRPLR